MSRNHRSTPGDDMPSNPTGIKLPPPVLFLASILLGLSIQRLAPLGLIGGGLGGTLGLLLVVAGLSLVVLAARELFKARTTVRPDRGATALITNGPFRISRNPIYLGFALLQVGIALCSNNLWILLLLGINVVLLNRLVIAREERYLEAAFGKVYRDYSSRVRRWI